LEHLVAPVPHAISIRAAQKPDAVAIDSISTGERITWSEVDGHCRRWADALRRLRVEAGETVATILPNVPSAIYAWLGCGWLRAIEVPVNSDYQGEWLTHAVSNSQARVVVISQRCVPQLTAVAASLEHVDTVVVYDAGPEDRFEIGESLRVLNGEEFFAGAHPARDLEPPKPSDVMGVIYTSGTTGRTKAVLQPWGMVESTVMIFGKPEFENIVHYSFFAQCHGLGKAAIALPAALDGRLVMRERFSITDFWDDTRKYGCTATFTMSVIPNFLLRQPPRDDDADNPLRAVIMGPVIPEVDEFKRRFGVEVYTTFGSTEVGGVLFTGDREVNGSNWRSAGRVVSDAPTEIAIVDELDYPVGPNQVGELVVRPRRPWTMSLGYYNMPEETARAWRNGWFHTGDSFTYDEDGEYYFFDRAKEYIRRRGENISSFEVERAVFQYPGVMRAAAVPVPSEVGEDEVMVFVLPQPGKSIDPADLVPFLQERMPGFAVPRYVEVVDSLPMTQATFRVRKAELRDRGPTESTFDRVKAGI
jgi:crotonobetaine/carnitine-CoA ligase